MGVPPCVLGDLVSVYHAITVLMVISFIVYFALTIDTVRRVSDRRGWPVKSGRFTTSPLVWAEWSIPFMISGNVVFAFYRLWLRFVEKGGSDDSRLFYTDLYRLIGVLTLYTFILIVRRRIDR